MKLRFLILLAGACLVSRAADSGSAYEDIRRIDATRLEALVTRNLDELRMIFHPDCVYTHATGRTETGSAYLERLERGDLRYLAMAYDGIPAVHRHGGTVIVTGTVRLRAQARSGPASERLLATTAVYVETGSVWRLVSYQSTPSQVAEVR